jgi:molecular chaperone GrpE
MRRIEGDVMTEKVNKEEESKAQETAEEEVKEESEVTEEEVKEGQEAEGEAQEEGKTDDTQTDPLEELQKKYDEKQKEADEYLNMLKRTMADFDNFRKRTAKEKESLFDDGYSDAVKNLLPVLDNLERAEQNSSQQEGSLYEGVKMVLKIFRDLLEKSGVKEIDAEGVRFDPDYHNAILHVEDDSVGENIIVEVFQRGFIYKGKVIRHSLVKVAN